MSESAVQTVRVGERLRITEIFRSLQGEARSAGLPTVFIRLTGCPLRCQYCDTAYAFSGGQSFSFDQILAQVGNLATQSICVTGGEPLAQAGCHRLLTELCDAGYDVSLETSGAIDVSKVDARVSRVLDIKTPGSGEVDRNLWANLQHLTPHDQIKFVVCDRKDFAWACEITERYHLLEQCVVWVSPSYEQVTLTELADWLLGSGTAMRLQSQLHKLLWNDAPGR